MKKFLSVLLCAAFLFTAFSGSIAFATNTGTVSIEKLKADACDARIGESKSVTFYASVLSRSARVDEFALLYDQDGNAVAKLYDNGQNGDKVAGDLVYSAQVQLTSQEKGYKKYYAKINGTVSEEYDINFYHLLTDDEFKLHDDLWAQINALESENDKNGVASDVTLQQVYKLVKSSPYVERIDWQTDYSFSFNFVFGNTSVYARWDMAPRTSTGTDADIEKIAESIELMSHKSGNGDNVTWSKPDFAVFRPYRQSPYQGDFDNEFYTDIADSVMEITGGTTTDFQESEAYPGNLIDLDDYGFYIIDSHGTTAYAGGVERSYMMMRSGDTSNYEYRDDISAGHLISSGNDVGVTGTFFTKYFERDGKTFDNMMMYLVVCFGLATTGISQPVLDLGGVLVAGYTESVSFRYDFLISEKVWQHMLEVSPNDPSRNYTFEEAVVQAKEETYAQDPWGSPPSVLIFAGDGNYSLSATPIPITEITLTPNSADMYINNTLELMPMVVPADANVYELSYSTSNEEVAAVNESGLVTANSVGTATITVTATEVIDEQVVTHTSTCTVNVLGTMPVSGMELENTELELYTGTLPTQLKANVFPENASDKTVLFESSDENILTIDADGMITPINAGIAVVYATTRDGGFRARCVCYVYAADVTAAFNATGGNLIPENTSSYSWVEDLTSYAGRISLVSTNSSVPNSKCSISLNAGVLPVGTVVKFDWKVDSEQRYDKLSFFVNSDSSSVSNISGMTSWATYSYTVSFESDYVFKWSYDKDSSVNNGSDKGWIDNVEIIVPNSVYTVEFIDRDGTAIESVEVAHGEAAVAPQPPEHSGFEFIGWDKPFSEVRSDLVVTAIYIEADDEPVETYYTVTFKDYDGRVISTQSVLKGTAAVAPQDPTREDYVFRAWDKAFDNIIEDTQITAVYALLGDANLDSFLNTGDAAYVLRYLVGLDVIEFDPAADFNCDGRVNSGDASAILAFIIFS